MSRAGALFFCALAMAQTPNPKTEPQERQVEFVCPMDRDVRSAIPARCPRCGMKLEPGIPEFVEYPVKFTVAPPAAPAGQKIILRFQALDPKTSAPVRKFALMHEKLFHLFIVSHDLDFFAHEHPDQMPDGSFRFETVLPKAGLYRVLSDFYPEGGTPQLNVKTLITAGAQPSPAPKLAGDLTPKQGENLRVELSMEPPQPIAGKKTMLFLKVIPRDDLEQYLGAWGHMLVASDDLIDLIHLHPAWPDPGAEIQFNLLFPREAVYRVWAQFQRQGKVNTVSFTVPVKALR